MTERRRLSTFELLLLATIAAAIVAAHVALKLPLKLPGHSGIVWMALLVVARGIVPKPGAAAVAGLLSGAVAAFVGAGDTGALDTVLSYTAAGVGVDAVATLARRARAWSCAAGGLAGNLAKLAVKIALEIWIGIPTGFVLVGWMYPALTHAAFGLAGGYLGFLVLEALRRAGYFAYLAEKR
jgi:ABC-type thiamin/hydroxymethylpyrimidine transport system permease subunit